MTATNEGRPDDAVPAGSDLAPPGHDGAPPGRRVIEEALAGGSRSLDEEAGKELFQAYGIPVPRRLAARTADEAVAAATAIGYPVVLKASAPGVQHKSDAGLVLLGVSGEAEVREGFRTLELRASAAGTALTGVLVEQMVPGKREFVVGLSRDPLFGPVVMFGLGGVLTEVLHDVAFAVPPLTDADVDELLESVKAKALLGRVRGEPAVDKAALRDIIKAVARMGEDHPEIVEIDINPLLVDGAAPVAVDALVVVGEPAPRSIRRPADLSRLGALVAPRSVAVVGASSDTSKWGGMLVANLRLGGFPGAIYPVNPKGGTILGLPVHASISALPEAPDLAIVAVNASLVDGVVDECGRKGVRAVVVVSAGFSETGAQGRKLEDQVVRTAESYGIGLVGPNCMGVISSHHKLYATGFTLLRPRPGGVSMVSQSGNLGTQLLVAAEARQGGVGVFAGVGNEAMIDAVDLIDYLRTDPFTTTIVAYIEGFDDGRRLLDVVKATSPAKPVVVLRAGLTEYGARAAASHTGALTSSSAVFAAAARQSGMLVTTDPDEFMDLAFALAYLPLPPGKRIGVATMGGGWGVIVSDEIARCGLQLARLSPSVVAGIDGVLPSYWSRSNPVDLVATLDAGAPEAVVELLAASEDVDAVLVLGVIGSMSESRRALTEIERLKRCAAEGRGLDDEECRDGDGEPVLSERETRFIEDMAGLMERYCKPIISVSFKPLDQAVFPAGGKYSSFVLPSPLRAVRALAKMSEYAAYRRKRGLGQGC